jgi:D-alanyl-lipoteichoic acid acyltransferase DltB (MBOAT superfamily)
MSLLNILILIAAALALRLLFPGRLRRWALLVSSVVAIYWLQPSLPVRQMDFWFPTATLGLVLASWALTAEKEQFKTKQNRLAAALALGTVLLLGLLRFVSLKGILTASRPPQFPSVLIALLVIALLTALLVRFLKPTRPALTAGVLLILVVFVLLKTPALASLSSAGLRSLMGQDTSLALPSDLGWLGFSYVAFRLIHTLIDRMNGRLKEMDLDEVLIYTIFFPTFMAGPLDRLQRFRKDLNDPQPLDAEELRTSGKRLATGLFRKFILADTLALIAITPANVTQVRAAGWLWLMLAAYSFQLYFDFAGYSDIAIGMGRLLGFTLPENFNHPYRQPNLTQFWNNWHMTLTQWVRGYFFNPVTRALRKNKKLPAPLVIFITQVSTMLVMGLWHGITPNFIIWGLWHGLGLFIHNRWSSFANPKKAALIAKRPALDKVFNLSGVAFNFVFVSLGWVWFALPTPALALQTFGKLFGIA